MALSVMVVRTPLYASPNGNPKRIQPGEVIDPQYVPVISPTYATIAKWGTE